VLAGDGAHEDDLRRRADGLEHVRFLGRVHPDDLSALYASAVSVVVPSLAYETFGLIALEAFGQGTPVIARDLGAVSELVRESGGGLVYTTEDELADAMEQLRTDEGRRDELGRQGYVSAVTRWSEEPHLDAYFALIEEAQRLRRGHALEALSP